MKILGNLGEKLGLGILSLMINTFVLVWFLLMHWIISSATASTFWFETGNKLLFGFWGFMNIYGLVMILMGWPNHLHRFFGKVIFVWFR